MLSRYLYNAVISVAISVLIALATLMISTASLYLAPKVFRRAELYASYLGSIDSPGWVCYLGIYENGKLIKFEPKVPFVVYVLSSSSGNLSLTLSLLEGVWNVSICVEGWGVEKTCRILESVNGIEKLSIAIPSMGTYLVTLNATPINLRKPMCRIALSPLYTYRQANLGLVLSYVATTFIVSVALLSVAMYLARKGIGWGFGGWVTGSTWLPFLVAIMAIVYVVTCSPFRSIVVADAISDVPVGTPMHRDLTILYDVFKALNSLSPSFNPSYLSTLVLLSSVAPSLAFASIYEFRAELYETLLGLSKRRIFAWKALASSVPMIVTPLALYATTIFLTYPGLAWLTPSAMSRSFTASTIILCIVVLPTCAISTFLSLATRRCFIPIIFGGLTAVMMLTKLRHSLLYLLWFVEGIAWGVQERGCKTIGYNITFSTITAYFVVPIAIAIALYIASYAIFMRREV